MDKNGRSEGRDEHGQNRRWRFWLAAACVAATLAGCYTDFDVNRSAVYPTEYAVGNVYELLQPVFVADALLLPPGFHGGVPEVPAEGLETRDQGLETRD